jgi:hypothetical protein
MNKLLATLLAISSGMAHALTIESQGAYDESVGYAYGYISGLKYTVGRCLEYYPAAKPTIERGVYEWKFRNAKVLREVHVQWEAYVERDSKLTKMPPSAYLDFLERNGAKSIDRNFATIGGFQSQGGRERCVNLDKIVLNDTAFDLELKLKEELAAFRSCRENGYCPNLLQTEETEKHD